MGKKKQNNNKAKQEQPQKQPEQRRQKKGSSSEFLVEMLKSTSQTEDKKSLVVISRSAASSTSVRLLNFAAPSPLPIRPEDTAPNSVERELVLKYNHIIQAAENNSLTLDIHVAPFVSFLFDVRQSLIVRHNIITRKFKVRRAMLSRATRQTVDRLYHEICVLEIQEEAVKRDQNAFNIVLNLFHNSEPYKEFLRFGQEHMIHLSNGQYMMKDSEMDKEISFEEYLATEKRVLGIL
eukprot:c9486_g1_i1.p1 GENE.c9486_g1_i1~~c9486_g1_i1.p1  ORF type:complete len:236 (-),score=50.51 c9486_g1_i1:35-742(-)